MDFGKALEELKQGKKVARKGWNGKGMYLRYIDNRNYKIHEDFTDGCAELSFIAMKTADNRIVPWLASQTDILAEDWEVVK
jgi:hypothetical protein